MNIINDPTFIPITIIFLVLLLVALWQKLDRYILPLSVVYIVYAVYSTFTFDETVLAEIEIKPVKNQAVVVDKFEKSIKPEVVNVDPGEVHLHQDSVSIENELLQSIPDLRVNVMLFCEDMNDSTRKTVNKGTEFPISLGKVYCYSGIRNALGIRTIFYEWYFEGNFVDKIPVYIERSVHWRSWTVKTINNSQIGNWYVVIRDDLTKTPLDTAYFNIIDE